MADILPLCTTREIRGRVLIEGAWHVPCFCMNCHQQKGWCSEPVPGSGYVGYLCPECAETWSPLVGTMLVPDTAHALIAADAMREDYGRVLSDAEQAIELGDVNSALSRFVRS
jgi:hypothetical protein